MICPCEPSDICPECESKGKIRQQIPEEKPKAKVINCMMHGIGDAVITGWIAHNTRDRNPCLLNYATGQKRIVLEMFGQTIAGRDCKMVDSFDGYTDELHRYEEPRLLVRAERLGFILKEPLERPPTIIADEYHEWAKKQYKTKPILLFPVANYSNREWPACYWIELAAKLEAVGQEAIVMLPEEMPEFMRYCKRWYTGQDWRRIAALMLQSALVVSNDSGAAHVAGTLDVDCLALTGAFTSSIYWHIPSVTTLHSAKPCTGCHFLKWKGFQDACNVGCASLHELTVDQVFHTVLFLLQ